jgi:hypothetical protein
MRVAEADLVKMRSPFKPTDRTIALVRFVALTRLARATSIVTGSSSLRTA